MRPSPRCAATSTRARTRYEIIVSADGDDGTREVVAAPGGGGSAPVGHRVRRARRQGPRRAQRAWRRRAGTVVGFVDADGKTPIEELDKLLPWLEQGYDVVIGSRGLAESRIEVAQRWYRRLGSRAFGVLMHLVMGLPHVRDTQCGFKFFRGPVARDLFARQRIDGYMFDIELLHLWPRARAIG